MVLFSDKFIVVFRIIAWKSLAMVWEKENSVSIVYDLQPP